MRGVSVFLILGFYSSWVCAQFLNNRPFPTYSLENMPDTDFSCRDKILGGYYADVDTQCQMFHVCVKVAGVGVQDFRFLCPNGTGFDQDHQICADWEDVDCDATTLYYSSDNFDLYRLGSGFESKARKYGEDEEPFALQRAETGDVRVNKEHQSQRVNQHEDTQFYKKAKKQNYNANADSERDIFKGSSSSNFFNNKNGGKENDEDYDDRGNANQDRDAVQKKKLVRKQQRRPVQNNQQPQQQTQQQFPQQQQQQQKPQQQQRPQQQQQQRPQQQQQQQQQQRPQQQPQQQQYQNQNQNQPPQPTRNINQQVRNQPPRPQPKPQNNEYQTNKPPRPTGFINNFAGSSYQPTTTTARPTSTTLNDQQYTEAIRNYQNRNGQRTKGNSDRQYNNADNFRQIPSSVAPTYTVSTPSPFRPAQQQNNNYPKQQSQQFNNPTTANVPKKQNIQQNYQPKQEERFDSNYDIPKIKPTNNYPQTTNQQFNKQFNDKTNTPIKQNNVAPTKQTENYPTTFAPKFVKQQNQNAQVNNQNFENYPTTFAPRISPVHNQVPQQSTQFKAQPTPFVQNNQANNQQNKPAQQYNQQFNQNNQASSQNSQQFNNSPKPAPFNNQYPPSTQQYLQNVQQFSSQKATVPTNTFNQQQNNQFNNQNNFNQQQSTPKSTPFTQYTPTVPKITSTTPVSRSNRFDETQYDDGSYNPKYDYDGGDRKDDEFLKTAHSQNIASSRNELAKAAKNNQAQQQKTYYESPRPFSVSPNTPKATQTFNTQPPKQNFVTSKPTSAAARVPEKQQVDSKSLPTPSQPTKKTKDVSYDYAYYDTNADSEPEYEIDTEFKKSSIKN